MNETTRSVHCVVVGDAAVGKTSMILGYSCCEFPAVYEPTVFDSVMVAVPWSKRTVVSLQLFDVGAMEASGELRNIANPIADVFVLCFSVADPRTLTNVEQMWAPEVRRTCRPNVPLLLVGTQTDRREVAASACSGIRGKGRSSQQRRNSCDGELFVDRDAGVAAARRVVADRYMECSALKRNCLDNVFEEAIRCALRET